VTLGLRNCIGLGSVDKLVRFVTLGFRNCIGLESFYTFNSSYGWGFIFSGWVVGISLASYNRPLHHRCRHKKCWGQDHIIGHPQLHVYNNCNCVVTNCRLWKSSKSFAKTAMCRWKLKLYWLWKDQAYNSSCEIYKLRAVNMFHARILK